ncbi:hypothetical protein KNZ04_01990 [Streptococcus dysgalactiae subsp. equisimilis]|nr:hypothetical protein KNZ04_01990 [Streptococcus dysgalactiae subsp. equisimilis]
MYKDKSGNIYEFLFHGRLAKKGASVVIYKDACNYVLDDVLVMSQRSFYENFERVEE